MDRYKPVVDPPAAPPPVFFAVSPMTIDPPLPPVAGAVVVPCVRSGPIRIAELNARLLLSFASATALALSALATMK